MADNYLERRMEDFLKGKSNAKRSKPAPPPPRCVVVAGGTEGEGYDTAVSFRKQGWRVAVFGAGSEAGRKMAYEHGVRYHNVDISDPAALAKETESLLRVWRNIHTVAGSEQACRIMTDAISRWRSSLPIPDTRITETIILNTDNK
ncbi:MAG: hypothetical protein K2K93_02750 [Muribaculaceae bacterium]|nr:hypothetical protein [Muribaculaceae bacterium]